MTNHGSKEEPDALSKHATNYTQIVRVQKYVNRYINPLNIKCKAKLDCLTGNISKIWYTISGDFNADNLKFGTYIKHCMGMYTNKYIQTTVYVIEMILGIR